LGVEGWPASPAKLGPVEVSGLLMLAGITIPVWLYLALPKGAWLSDAIYTVIYILAITTLGLEYRRFPLIVPLGFAVGLAFEVLGVSTGLPFGRYRYVALDSARLVGVPLIVPVMWGVFSALAYLAARPFTRGIRLVLLASSLMVVLDLALDPAMTSWQAWVWEGGWGPWWQGVPLSNFTGWFLVSAIVLGLYEMALKGDGPHCELFTVIYIYSLSLQALHAPRDAGLLALSLGITLLGLAHVISRRRRQQRHVPPTSSGRGRKTVRAVSLGGHPHQGLGLSP